MKKRISIRELKAYCDEAKPKEVAFLTENQPEYRVSDPCKISCTFPSMIIYENPNLVCLKSGNNTICFDRVKFAEIDTDATVIGTVLKLFCGERVNDTTESPYILVVA